MELGRLDEEGERYVLLVDPVGLAPWLAALLVGAVMAGIGYVMRDGQPEPVRIRLAWVSDIDIAEAVERYGPPKDGRPLRVVPS